MKISADQIAEKGIAGKTDDGKPVVYIATHGGLHAFFMKDEDGSISSIGAAPHKAIAKFLAGKKAKIEWNEDFSKSESLTKSEDDLFSKLRRVMFMPHTDTTSPSSEVYLVYDMDGRKIEVMKKSELEEEIKSGGVSRWALVRDTSLTKRSSFLKDSEEFQHLFEEAE